MDFTFEEIARAVNGRLVSGAPGAAAKGVSTDSRGVRPGEVFFALRGPNFDGRGFVRDAASKGAVAAVAEGPVEGLPASFGMIVVEDAVRALGDLASHARGLCRAPLIAVTGSAGKTTTKEMIASILGRTRSVLKTRGNMNNLIGMPLTLLASDGSHGAAVIELGVSVPGEMARLAAICRPDVGVITNVGRAHLESLGSVEGVAMEKGALFASMKDGVKVVNLDDPWVERLAAGNGRQVTYSVNRDADVRVRSFEARGFGSIKAVYDVRGNEVEARLDSPNPANVVNGAAAIAACLPMGAEPEDAGEGLSSFSTVHGRMEVLRANGLTILDDAYNANPESSGAAIRTLAAAGGRKVAVLGDMLELGEASRPEHRRIGALAGESGIDVLVAIGRWSKDVADGFVSASGAGRALCFGEKAPALEALRSIVAEGDFVLVKGSRAMALEDAVDILKNPGSRRGTKSA